MRILKIQLNTPRVEGKIPNKEGDQFVYKFFRYAQLNLC